MQSLREFVTDAGTIAPWTSSSFLSPNECNVDQLPAERAWPISEHLMIAACIGVTILLAFATLTWKKRKGVLASALATKNVLEPSEAIVKEHAPELTLGRKQLTITLSDGSVDDSKWLAERDFFIDQVVEPQVGNITDSLERLLAVWQMIDEATAQIAASRTTELPVPPAATGDRTDVPASTIVVAYAA